MQPAILNQAVRERIQRITSYLPELREGQLIWVERIVLQFRRPKSFWQNPSSNLITECFLEDFGDALRLHHCFSDDAFAKDKFEYTAVRVWQQCGKTATMAPRGNPGHDINVGTERISLKTQADRSLRLNEIRIHKFMELGKGSWSDHVEDLNQLLAQFLHHLEGYNRILVLRNTGNPSAASPYWQYELVEIPLSLLQQASSGEMEMMFDSKQSPKPGYCRVFDSNGQLAFRLYFDGGTERKLQIHKIRKDLCTIHATWRFIVHELDEAQPTLGF